MAAYKINVPLVGQTESKIQMGTDAGVITVCDGNADSDSTTVRQQVKQRRKILNGWETITPTLGLGFIGGCLSKDKVVC